jgi:hypothetical protein
MSYGIKNEVDPKIIKKGEGKMSKTKINWIGTFDKIKDEDDLKPKPGININPPDEDGRCDCCGRHISELEPFGGPGDPLVGDFTGAYLVKGYRSDGPYVEEVEKAWEEALKCYEVDGFDHPDSWLINKFGEEEAMAIVFAVELYNQVGSSWECRDCAVLDEDEYFEKLKRNGK